MRKLNYFALDLKRADPDNCARDFGVCAHRQYFECFRVGEGRYDLVQNTRCYGEYTHDRVDGPWVRQRIYGWRNYMATPTQREMLDNIVVFLDAEEDRLNRELWESRPARSPRSVPVYRGPVAGADPLRTARVTPNQMWAILIDELVDSNRPTAAELNLGIPVATINPATWTWTA